MTSNLQGIELTDPDVALPYNFEIFKRGNNQQRGVDIATKEWEIGDPVGYWKVPLFPFDGGLRQDRLPLSANISTEPNRPRTYAKANIDATNEGVLVPPPALNNTDLTNITTSTKQKSFDGKQFHLCGRFIYTVERDGTLSLDKDFGSGKAAVDFEVFNNELIVAMGETEKIWKRATGGTWTQATNDTFAIALGVVGNILWRAHSVNQLSNAITAPLTLASWTPADPNEYKAGDETFSIHGIIEYGGIPVVLRPDGVFFPDSRSEFHNQAPQIANWPHIDNGKGAFVGQGYLWVPTVIGLLRITQGESLIRGPENSNRPDFRFWVRGGIEWGEYIYLLVTDEIESSDTFICKMVRDRLGISGKEYIYHEWVRLGSSAKGYSLAINTWPSQGPISLTRDPGTVASVAGAGIDWTNASNAVSSNDTYATAGAGTTDPLRFSNFGFAIPADATILGYLVGIERKTSAASATSTKTAPDAVSNDTGIGSRAWSIDLDGPTFSFAQAINTTAVLSNYLKLLDWNFAIPTNATITGVTVTISKQTLNGVLTDSVVRLVTNNNLVGNNKALVAGWPLAKTGVVYGSTTDKWGATLTPALVNATNFGFVIAANIGTDSQGFVWGDGDTSVAVTYTVDGTEDSQVRLINASATAEGDNKASTSDWSASDTLVQYGAEDDLWGTTFTPANINDSDFGFQLVVVNPSGITASVDYGNITVVYQEADIVTNPVLFAGHGSSIKYIQLGFGSGRDIDDPSYPFGNSFELETGLTQPIQDVTLISGLVGVSVIAKVRDTDTLALQYSLGADENYSYLLTNQEGSGALEIVSDGSYQQFTRYAPPNTLAPYFKFKIVGLAGAGAGQDRLEIRNMWAYGYIRPKVTDIIGVPIYCDSYEMHNGIPQGRGGGDTLRLFRAWKRDQKVLTLRFPDYEEVRTVRVRVFEVQAQEIINELQTEGTQRQTLVANVTFMRDDFANEYGNS